jgi:hypothetical protein
MLQVLKKVNMNVWQTCHDLFEISGIHVRLGKHHIFETFLHYFEWLKSKYYVKCYVHQSAPTPNYRQHYHHYCIWTRTLVWLNCHYLFPPKSKGKTEETSHIKQQKLQKTHDGLLARYQRATTVQLS